MDRGLMNFRLLAPCCVLVVYQIVAFLQDSQKSSSPIPEADLIPIIWNGLMSSLDTSGSNQHAGDAALKWIKVSS